ncbi:MAG: c-type cytochrome [Spirochaetia bacterium]|nr:c-type cytochrome [Spirochaetia bacterium]
MNSKHILLMALAVAAIGCKKSGLTDVRPYRTSDDQMFMGSLLYAQQGCQNCHGTGWDGKGPEAAGLPVPPTNFVAAVGPEKTPVVYFKAITAGTEKFKAHSNQALTDAGRWAMANFLFSIRKPLTGEKAVEQSKNVETQMAEVRKTYKDLAANNRRRWEIGYKPNLEREKAPELKDLLKYAAIKPDLAPGTVSEERLNRPMTGEGAAIYANNCASCHGNHGEGKSITYGMGLIKGQGNMHSQYHLVRAAIATRDFATSDSIGSGGALKGAHPAGGVLQDSFASLTDAEWASLSEFIRSIAQ